MTLRSYRSQLALAGWLFTKKTDPAIYAPVSGTCIPLEQVNDPVFSSKAMGEGVAFRFEGDTICAPCAGKVVMIAATSHAIGLQADNGAELLIHIGMDTVELNGEGFTLKTAVNKKVKKGDPLLVIDRAFMQQKGIDLTTPMIVTNGKEMRFSALNQPVTGASVVMSIA